MIITILLLPLGHISFIKSIREYDEIMKRAYDKISNMKVERERERKVRGTGHS
jgi:hypothetical protein